jgi:hypothetical protein
MASSPDLPGTLNLAVRAGDEIGKALTYNLDLTGYTARSAIYSLVTGLDVSTVTTTVTAGAASSVVNVSIQESLTASLAPGTYGWRQELVAPGAVQATRIDAFLEVVR